MVSVGESIRTDVRRTAETESEREVRFETEGEGPAVDRPLYINRGAHGVSLVNFLSRERITQEHPTGERVRRFVT